MPLNIPIFPSCGFFTRTLPSHTHSLCHSLSLITFLYFHFQYTYVSLFTFTPCHTQAVFLDSDQEPSISHSFVIRSAPSMRKEERVSSEQDKALEINLISAQNLKPPTSNLRRMQTYALLWVDPAHKVRTRTDRLGAENPTWNDKFFFKVPPDFLSSETSAVSIQIFAVGYLRDHLIGTVRFLTSNFIFSQARTPAFSAVQIRRPSGRFHGVLNIGASVIDGSEFPAMGERSAIGFPEQVGESERRWRHRIRSSAGAGENDVSVGGESMTSSSSSSSSSTSTSTSMVLEDWNGIRGDLAGNKGLNMRRASDGSGLLCGLMMTQRKFCSYPYPYPSVSDDFEWVPEKKSVR